MSKINLRDYYYFYKNDYYIDLPDDIIALLHSMKKEDAAYQRRVYRNKAYFSMDCHDGIEGNMIFVSLSAEEIYEREITRMQLHAAIAALPDKQAKRLYAHYFLGMTLTEIARTENIALNTAKESIERGLRNLEKYFKKNL